MKSWFEKLFIIEGILFAIIGIFFFINPFRSLVSLINICAYLLIAIGIFTIVRAFYSSNKLMLILSGILSIIFGIVLLMTPFETIDLLVLFFGVWCLVRGLYLLIITIKYKNFGINFSTLYTIILIILGILILYNPFAAVLSSPYFVGTYFIVTAISEIYLGFTM